MLRLVIGNPAKEVIAYFKYVRCCTNSHGPIKNSNANKNGSTDDKFRPFTMETTSDNSRYNKSIQIREKKEELANAWFPSPYINHSNILDHCMKLSKFRLTTLVVITAMGGYAIAPAPFNLGTFIMCSLGTGFMSAAANAINQYHEVPFDSQMSRTKNRVLVTGKVTPLHAIGFAIVSATLGMSMLLFGANGLTAALGATNLILYTSIYTPMKRVSIINTWIGSIVGAIPPLIGYAGCAGELGAGAYILASLLYAWQFPHFNALSWNLRSDYSRAGYRMMAVTEPNLCRKTALRYSVAIGGLSILVPFFDVTNIWFAVETLPLNIYFIYLAYLFYKKSDSGSSRKLFRFSLIHLPILMILFICNKKRWILTDTTHDEEHGSKELNTQNNKNWFKKSDKLPDIVKKTLPTTFADSPHSKSTKPDDFDGLS